MKTPVIYVQIIVTTLVIQIKNMIHEYLNYTTIGLLQYTFNPLREAQQCFLLRT